MMQIQGRHICSLKPDPKSSEVNGKIPIDYKGLWARLEVDKHNQHWAILTNFGCKLLVISF